jgi:3-hydroxyethyl bacteriochlorophyllide a dehydrogenase
MNTLAIVLKAPGELALDRVALIPMGPEDVVVDVEYSGVSTGTERLLWSGRMPAFPGMGYPLVPGYESVGRIVDAGERARTRIGERVFVPGSSGYADVRGLFGGAARRLVTSAARVAPVQEGGAESVLLALAATAYHALAARNAAPPDLIVGHGVLGRLLARVAIACGHPAPVVWEREPARRDGALGYAVRDPAQDERRDYASIYDVSGDAALLDEFIARLAPGGEIVLAGFYDQRPSFAFPPAFMREARLRVAAEWKPADLAAVQALLAKGLLRLDDIVTHVRDASDAPEAYRTAFEDSSCLKMVLDWRTCA